MGHISQGFNTFPAKSMSVQGDAQAINSPVPTCGSRLQDTRSNNTRTSSWTQQKLKTKLKVRRTVNPWAIHTQVFVFELLCQKVLPSFSCGGCVCNTCYSLEAVLLKKTCLKIEWDCKRLLRRKQGKEGKTITLGQHHISSRREGLASTKSSPPASPLMPLHSIAMSDWYSGRDVLI